MLVSRGMPIVNIAKVGARSMVLSFLLPSFFSLFVLVLEKKVGEKRIGGVCGVVVRWGGAIEVRRRCFLMYLD